MNNLARWETHYAPVSVGLEDMFKRLDAFSDSTSNNYPPYDLLKLDDERQVLSLALAGFSKDDIEVSVEQKVLNIQVTKTFEPDGTYVYKGIARRSFSRNWQLSEQTVVDDVTFTNGILSVTLRREVPEEQKRKVLPISQ